MHNGNGLDVHLRRNGGLALVVVATLEVTVGRIPIIGAESSLLSVDGDAQNIVGIRHDISKVRSHRHVTKLGDNLVVIWTLLDTNNNVTFGAVVHLCKRLAGCGRKNLANGSAMRAVICLDDLHAHGKRVGSGRSPIRVFATLGVDFAQLRPTVVATRGLGTAGDVWIARCRQNELAIGLVCEERGTSIATATLEVFALDGVDTAITASGQLKAPDAEVEVASGSTAGVQGQDSRDGEERKEADDRLGSHCRVYLGEILFVRGCM